MDHEPPYVAPFIRCLMPNASEQEILDASENLAAYLKLLYGMFLRQEADKQGHDSETRDADARFDLDGCPPSSL